MYSNLFDSVQPVEYIYSSFDNYNSFQILNIIERYSSSKIEMLRTKSSIRVLLYQNAANWYKNICDAILSAFPTIEYTNIDPDISILEIIESRSVKPSESSIVILINGEANQTPPFPIELAIQMDKTKQDYPILHYPLLFYSIEPIPIKSKSKFCAFMYNASYNHRDEIFHSLHKLRSVDGLGTACNNISIPSTRHLDFNRIAVETYTDYYFVLAIENKWCEGYSTEKLINPILANSIPIYWGHPYLFNYINKKRVIYYPDYESVEELYSYLERLMNNENEYLAILNEPTYLPNKDLTSLNNELIKQTLDFFQMN